MWWMAVNAAMAWTLIGAEGAPLDRSLSTEDVFAVSAPHTLAAARVDVDAEALISVAQESLRYLQSRAEADPLAVHAGMLSELGVTLAEVENTLTYLIAVATQTPERLDDPAFWSEEFVWYVWQPDQAGARARGVDLPAGQLRLTRYLVYQMQGSRTQTAEHPFALYAVPNDEAGLSVEQADAQSADLTRFQYSRADVMGGVYAPGGAAEGAAEPLVWLSRRGVYEAMMQGTIEVHFPDGQHALFNVDRPNGMPYNPAIRSASQQLRYWYFAEVDGVMGWGAERAHKVRLAPGVAVAGDVHNLGLGKLIVLEQHGVARPVVLSDTGGAFQPNLFQLDLFTGTFPSREAFLSATRHMGGFAGASILIRREPSPSPQP